MKMNIPPTFTTILGIFLLLLTSACQPMVNSEGDDLKPVSDTDTEVAPTETKGLALEPIPVPTKALLPTLSPTTLIIEPTPISTSSTVVEATIAPTRAPTPTVLAGTLVFESRRNDTNDDNAIDIHDGIHLYTLNLTSGEIKQLTTGDQMDRQPSWSPDQTQIAFVSNREGNYELYTMNADGTHIERLTNSMENEAAPVWSPDGTQIAYVLGSILDSGLAKSEIYVLSLENDQTFVIETNEITNAFEPDWSPDGRFIVFTGQTEVTDTGVTSYDNGIYLVDEATNNIHRLTSSGIQVDSPKWLPRDGHFVSLIQTPGKFSSSSVHVYEIRENGDDFFLQEVFIIEDIWGNYTWGANGEWFISVSENSHQDSSLESMFSSLDLAVAPIDFSTFSPQTSVGGSFYYSFFEESEHITDNSFYDNFPDWTP